MAPLIEIKKLSKVFKTKNTKSVALAQIDLTIEKGERVGLIGRSGAGKSTLLRCIATLQKPSEGQILFQGTDLLQLRKKELLQFRRKIGVVFQHFHLFHSRTAAQNISYALEIHGTAKEQRLAKVKELLALVDLSAKGDHYPSQLSGGEKQRVGIARALANAPQLLLCDEATSSLDPESTQQILALLRTIHETIDITLVLITHEMQIIRQLCHRVAILEGGRLVQVDRVDAAWSEPTQARYAFHA